MAQERRTHSLALSIGSGQKKHEEGSRRNTSSTRNAPTSPQSGHDNGASRSLPQTIPMSRSARQEKLAVRASRIVFQEQPGDEHRESHFDGDHQTARSLSFESMDSLSEQAFSFDFDETDEEAQQELERRASSQAGSHGERAGMGQTFGSRLGQADFSSPPRA
jgi:hypothetical protein